MAQLEPPRKPEETAEYEEDPLDFYRASKLKVLDAATPAEDDAPPWRTTAPELDVYRERGHRRLSARTYESACLSSVWGCRMAVKMIIDHWNPDKKRCRTETFCYGPKSCSLYKAGPTRRCPDARACCGRKRTGATKKLRRIGRRTNKREYAPVLRLGEVDPLLVISPGEPAT